MQFLLGTKEGFERDSTKILYLNLNTKTEYGLPKI